MGVPGRGMGTAMGRREKGGKCPVPESGRSPQCEVLSHEVVSIFLICNIVKHGYFLHMEEH